MEITLTVTPDQYQKHLEAAAERLSKRAAVHGFRPGKVPFEIMKRTVGEMNILKEALESIVQQSFSETIRAEKLETIGQPKIDIVKLAPANDVVYTATVALLPQVTLANIETIKVEKRIQPIDPKKIEETLVALRGMQADESIKVGPAGREDKLVIDMDMRLERVPIEGGQAKDYQVYLNEDSYIPGFNAALLGATRGDTKIFTLPFPAAHYQKMLAGKNVEFTVRVKEVYERHLPTLDEAFAKRLGQESVEELRKLVKKNLTQEAEQKADQGVEIEILDTLVAKSEFAPLPAIIIDAERQKMFLELKRDLERNGISIEQYMRDIKKSEAELFNDFRSQAEKRAKAALVLRRLAKEQGLAPTEEEITDEINHLKHTYKDNQKSLENLAHPEVRDSLATIIQSRKVIHWLKAKILGTALVSDSSLKDNCPDDDHVHHEHAKKSTDKN